MLIKLFFAFSIIGLFAFGGGYSSLSIMEDLVVKKFNFVDSQLFWKIVGIAQMTPGPIALNIATYVGAQKAKIFGSIVSTIAVIFFPSLLSFLLIIILNRYKDNQIIRSIFESLQKMIPVLVALSLLSLFVNVLSDLKYIVILLISFVLIFFFKKISILVKIIFCGFLSIIIYHFLKF